MAALVAATLFAGWQMLVERRQAAVFTAMSNARPISDSAMPPTPQEQVYRAQSLARQAAMLDGPARAAALDRAGALVAAGLARRPRWGEAWVVKAFVEMMRNGPGAPPAIAALARSYAETPFLRESADWRIGYVADQWPRIDARTRTAAVREAIVLTRISRTSAAHVRVMLAGTPLYEAVALRDMSDSAGIR